MSALPTDAPRADFLKKTNLYLVGMMGAGKTTVGRKLASRLGYRFVDTDGLIEQAAGQPITRLFEQAGEPAFRKLETQVLSQVSAHTRLVVATGGGIVTQAMNWSYLQYGVVIWLDTPVSILVSRLVGDTSRPLLKDVDLTAKLEMLLAERGDRYAQADLRIPYESRSVGKTCDHIIATLRQTIRPDRPSTPRSVVSQANINRPSSVVVDFPAKPSKS